VANILIVDDRDHVRQVLLEEFLDDGYGVASIDGSKPVKELISLLNPDLIIMDVRLKGRNGIRLVRDIKRMNKRLPIVIFTSHQRFKEDMRPKEVDGFILKSSSFDELKHVVANVLKSKADEMQGNMKDVSLPAVQKFSTLATCMV
jgi:DNA-binding NtrC family response regulator